MVGWPWGQGAWAAAAVALLSALPATAADGGIARIRAAGVLTVAVFDEDVPPFFYLDAGKLVGIDPWLSEDIAAKLGVALRFDRAAKTFDALVDEVAEGRADIAVSLLSDTLDRAMKVQFSAPYVEVRQFLLINRLKLGSLARGRPADTPVSALLNAPAARIGVIAGTSYVGFLAEDFPAAAKVEFDQWSDMLDAVKAGDLAALMYDEIEIGNWRLADPAGALTLRPYLLEGRPDTIAIAIRREDDDLKDWLDLYLEKLRNNGELDALLKRYLYTSERALTDE
jgi:ABC-type amino acid transport substrate-binding protein